MRTTIVVWLAALAANAEQPSAVLTDFGAEATAMTTPATPTARTPARSTLSAEARGARTKAVGWLLAHQKSDGGWASGSFGTSGAESASDAATTAFAVLALHREGAHPVEVRRGVEWVLRAVETAPEGPRLNTPEGTQIQYKLGALVDTHLASLMLGEVAPSLPAPLQSRARTALATCVRKIERAQNADGSFDGNAWAPVLSTAVAAAGLSQAAEIGVSVDAAVIAKSDAYQTAQASGAGVAGGSFDTSAGAGVQLYAVASTLKNATEAAARPAASAPAREEARKAAGAAAGAVSRDDGGLIAGFGSVGGEEMLSYMMISDTLAETGGSEFADWETKIGAFLASAQNADGSWVGHHCITSEAFATAGGVLTLSAGEHARREG